MAMMMMVVNSATTNMVTVVARPWTRCRACCSPSSVVSSHQLRSELDQLHSEADMARTKANNARLRLMRLSEAAEKLKHQAAISVQAGQENYARDLLLQKKKIMEALEKSKRRIELLDQLSAKLNEAITAKETQLIGNVSLDFEAGQEVASPVRIVPAESEEDVNGVVYGDHSYGNISENENLQVHSEGQYNDEAKFGSETTDNKSILNENGIIGSLRDISSYEEFLEHLDGQLNIIEAELAILIRLSTSVLEREEMPQNSKVHQTLEILEGIRSIRERLIIFTLILIELNLLKSQRVRLSHRFQCRTCAFTSQLHKCIGGYFSGFCYCFYKPCSSRPVDITAPTITPAATNSGHNSWCVARDTSSEMELQAALDYACGIGGADCSAIQPNGMCYSPSTLRHHASYAFNSYYQKNPLPKSCDFGSTAVVTTIDPSSKTCQFPTTSTSTTILNVTFPNSSTIFGTRPSSPETPSSWAKKDGLCSQPVYVVSLMLAAAALHFELLLLCNPLCGL
ncbi:hypothetical protein QQ045_025991 [Rhodiola kirilowii]